MTIAIWITAVCEIIRTVQNFIQIMAIRQDASARDNAYAEFVKSLKQTDREFVRRVLKEFDEQKGEQDG